MENNNLGDQLGLSACRPQTSRPYLLTNNSVNIHNRGRALTSTERSRLYRIRCRNRRIGGPSGRGTATSENRIDDSSGVGCVSVDQEIGIASQQCQPILNRNADEQTAQHVIVVRDPSMRDHWVRATEQFEESFKRNSFGVSCRVCDRLWFTNDLKLIKPEHLCILQPEFGPEARTFKVCANCLQSLSKGRLPTMSITNGFTYPPRPVNLPPLDSISTRLISPRIPFMSIRRLRRDGAYGILGQVINIPVDVNNMVRQLPRDLDDDYAINVSIKRKLIHKSSYLKGHVKKDVIKKWLRYLEQTPLYRFHGIEIDWSYFSREEGNHSNQGNSDDALIENIRDDDNDSELIHARQQTLLWNEQHILDIAPGQHNRPLNILFDDFAEELSFPQIYYGCGRKFNQRVRVTPYMIANSEIRRTDRRGVTPEHILYMCMKILRLRVVDRIHNSFRCVRQTENVTKRMLEDPEFLNDCVERNFSFLKSIPNSVYYWKTRRKDLFAMMRQIGKPSAFLTISANEINWPDLISLLNSLSDTPIAVTDPIVDLDRSRRCQLVNEDPVTTCLYFHKLVETIMTMIRSKKSFNPFGKYRVLDYFMRIEFQHRGSPHAHILLWLENDPKEPVSEQMQDTIQLVTDLCSVSRDDLPQSMYQNQVHKHTFTCTKRGETSCRFKIPYWPMETTRVLLPLTQNDTRLEMLRMKAKQVRENLEIRVYESIYDFLNHNRMSESFYLNIIRSTINRPTLVFKRNMNEIMTNTFMPWIGSILNANMDLQFILDEYSCAEYVVDYVNKSDRGTGNLHRELVKLNESNPELTYDALLKKLGAKILNTVEISAQEAAWWLLRQKMSHSSRDIVYIPTCWPCERQKSYKRKANLDALPADSTNIWTKTIIEKYEARPVSLHSFCLADFVSWYTKSHGTDDPFGPEGDENENISTLYKKRDKNRIIRFRNYGMEDTSNFKREMVTLYVPFKNELADVIDRNKFLDIYDQNLERISQKRLEYEGYTNIEQLVREMTDLVTEPIVDLETVRENFVRAVLPEGVEENNDDLNRNNTSVISAVRSRTNLMSKEDYCSMMRTTNERQRELILEFIHRIKSVDEKPIQIFFTGPAGCGKTYVLKLIMETFNRYCQNQNYIKNSYVACASTGKAAINLGGTTVHSAFHISQSRRREGIARETLQEVRQLFSEVECVVIDEISMIGSYILHQINQRLQEITGELETYFGGMNVVLCGDFRQLPPVQATPVYKGSRGHLEGALLWQSVQYYPLVEVMRQSDVTFSQILGKIGEGRALDPTESMMIESRFRTEKWCDENLIGTVRLFHQNHLVDSYNNKAIMNGVEHLSVDVFTGYRNNNDLTLARSKMHRMSTMETSGLPFVVKLGLGYPYMVTSNIDVEDGLVNGAMGILRYIEQGPPDENNISEPLRIWLEFSNLSTGVKARLKHQSIVVSRATEINRAWTPISRKIISVNLGSTLRCKRTQFPLTAACAMTVHKSQGGTFDSAVIQYDKNHQNQLVYVAMSRVTSIHGLYLVNLNNDNIFHHKSGSTAPSVKEIRDEYTRLSQHPLETITSKIKDFLRRPDGSNIIILCTINAQSLVAHASDIGTDAIIGCSDLLAITETWMSNDSPVEIDRYQLIDSMNVRSVTNDQDIGHTDRRTAGGVALYGKREGWLRCNSIVSDMMHQNHHVGDVSHVEITVRSNLKLILVTFYIHPNISKTEIEHFLSHALGNYRVNFEASMNSASTHEAMSSDNRIPLIVTGDFNFNIQDDPWLIDLMRSEYNLEYVTSTSPTTLGNTIIDLTFVRNLSATCMPFVAYFSYHRPLFTKIEIIDEF